MPLPKLGSKEWDSEVRAYIHSTPEWREKRAKELGYANKNSYLTQMLKRGIKLANGGVIPTAEVESKIEYLPYPDLKIKPFKIAKGQRDEEDIGIVLADHHVGRETATYNPTIYKARMDYLLDSAMTIINLHRPIGKAYVFALGDIVHGESVYKGGHIEECKIGAYGQIHEVAVPAMSEFLASLSQGVRSIEWFGVRGNHGRYDKTAVPRTNWDNFFYQALAASLEGQKNIKINVSTDFYQLVSIRGFRFFLIHGDQVRASQGVPLFALRRKYQEYYAYVGGFHYAYNGHWHVGGKDHINSIADYTMCPPLVTGDEWALEVIGRASSPVQLAFGIHNQYGRTWEYHLQCDKDFLPQPLKNDSPPIA
jgi:hypothetical protein